jgi:hypothetical protein
MRNALSLFALTLTLAAASGCSDAGTSGAGSASASAAKAPSAKPTTAATTTAAATATATAAASAEPRSDCPKDSSGPGTLDKPCAAKGNARLMEAKWTGKIDDEKGPYFAVTNKAPMTVLYGKIAVYFYDKAGKQLEIKDDSAPDAKPKPYLVCAGSNLFSGVMKKDEKATLTFSCVKKSHVPEGTAAIEGELITVGFADASEKKNEFYWSNPDLAPDQRAKGGVK